MSSPPDPAAIRQAYHDTFGSPPGKLVLADLLKRAGMLETSHVPGDPHDTAFREGRRSLALDVLDQLRWSVAELELLNHARGGALFAAAQSEEG